MTRGAVGEKVEPVERMKSGIWGGSKATRGQSDDIDRTEKSFMQISNDNVDRRQRGRTLMNRLTIQLASR